ncbi:hypothetical protein Cantr_00092 [Candida viswanathii]|uniref:Methyltransferase domain-containing protein n=1 Tax=Candida viswanathii TaxID=5486 RepID=A0A367YH32_9ASCO|nr:hypothetical protein Cantr_00092 [Candida viswanathii]
MSNHKEAVDANREKFNSSFAVKYEAKESQQLLALLFAKFILEYDFAHPTTRKPPQDTEEPLGDPTRPFNGFTRDNTLPDPATYLEEYPDTIFRPGMKLLDFACGTGMVTELFVPYVKGGELVGMDISSGWLERFNERAQEMHDPVMKSYVYDVLDETKQEELKQFEEQFDAIICTIAYHHMHNYELVTKKLATFLKHGGWLFIVDFYNEDVETPNVAPSNAVQHMGGLKIDSLNNTLANVAGLDKVSSAREFKTWVWQPEHFITSHLNQRAIDKLNNGELSTRETPEGEVEYLVETSLIYAVGQRK